MIDHDGFRGAVKVHQAPPRRLAVVYGTEVGMLRTRRATTAPRSCAESSVRRLSKRPSDRGGGGSVGCTGPSRRVATARSPGASGPEPAGYAAISRFVTRGQYRGEKDAPDYRYADLAEAARDGNLVALTGCHQGAVPRAARRAISTGRCERPPGCANCFPGAGSTSSCGITACRRTMLATTCSPRSPAPRSAIRLPPTTCTTPIATMPISPRCWRPSGDDATSTSQTAFGRPPTSVICAARTRWQPFRPVPGGRGASGRTGAALAFDLDLLTPELPDFPMPGAFTTEDEYLAHLVIEGAARSIRGTDPMGSTHGPEPVSSTNSASSSDLGFAGFFLVAWDIVQFARSQDIYCQIRGSGADSAVCRCIGLTRVDPIRLSLPFERFLSSGAGPTAGYRHRLRGGAA